MNTTTVTPRVLERAQLVGQLCNWKATLSVLVSARILDVRQSYGRNEVLIEPVAGSGQVWINRTSAIIPGMEGA